jgi:Ohr subfamily peroxiredoxin
MDALYKATAVSKGGRDGKVTVLDSPLEFEMLKPVELDGKKSNSANPEQLFAAGYSACFGSALRHVINLKKLDILTPTVEVTIGISKNKLGGFFLSAEIVSIFSDIDQDLAETLVKEAHQVCPYSKATRGNIDVNLIAKVM